MWVGGTRIMRWYNIIYIIIISLPIYGAGRTQESELRGPELLWHRTRREEICDCRYRLQAGRQYSWGRRRPEVFFRNRLPVGRNSIHVSPFSVTTCEKSHTMGCGTSSAEAGRGRLRADKELYLPSTELHFNAGQMQRLNDNFLRGYENSGTCCSEYVYIYRPTVRMSLPTESGYLIIL